MDLVDITEQIGRVLHSRTFANKSQLRKLLEVLYQNMDSDAPLKPEQVIKELWPSEVKTKRSADVATEVNRLRHALRTYYESEGDDDPVTIYLPNRGVTAGNGKHQRPWLVAKIRPDPDNDSGRVHPRTWLQLIVVGAIAAAFAIAGLFSIRMLMPVPQPRSGRLDGNVLRIMDATGTELWSKTFPQGFGPDLYYDKEMENGTRIWFGDLEGKGDTSVLFSYLPAPDAQPHSSTLICYSNRGKEKWRWTPGKSLPEVNEPSSYRTFSVGILKATQKRPPRIVVLSNLDPWWGGPSQVAVLNSKGKTLSEYWYSGGLRDMLLADVNGDGNEEIVATGNAHAYDAQATLVVLDADRVSGASKEMQPDFQLHTMGIAQEKLRVLFPRSDLNRAAFQFNMATQPVVEHEHLRVTVLECLAPVGCPMLYEFDKDFHLIGARPENDEFNVAHDRFYQKGKDAHRVTDEERSAFLKVRCLVGCQTEFVPVAESYDPATSFEKGWTTHHNPNSVWSYGYSSSFTDPIILYDKTAQNGINGPNAHFWLSSVVHRGSSPAVQYNNGPPYNDGNVDFPANHFVLVAGLDGKYSNVAFSAPSSSEYSIVGNFRGSQYGIGTRVAIVANGKIIFQSNISSVRQVAPFNSALHLQTGQKLVFSVGPGSGSQNTGLSVTVTRPCSSTESPAYTPAGEISCLSSEKLARNSFHRW